MRTHVALWMVLASACTGAASDETGTDPDDWSGTWTGSISSSGTMYGTHSGSVMARSAGLVWSAGFTARR